jgi:3-isopropylmalate dehydratase small subunit
MLLCSWFGDIFANESRNITYLPVLICPATSECLQIN